MSTLIITRKKAVLLMVPVKLILDGEGKGKLKNNQSVSFELAAGKHSIQIETTFGAKSEITEVELVDGQISQVEIVKSPRYMKHYMTRVFPLLVSSFLVLSISSSLGYVEISLLGFLGLLFSFFFVFKANKLMFDIREV